MGQNLTGQTIASTYEDLVQISGSLRNFLTDGTGSDITSLEVTASNAISSSYALTASFASNVPATASFAISASHADFADSSLSSSYAVTASYSETTAPITTIFENVEAGENLVKTDPVYLSGSSGANPIAFKADAANPAKMPAIYIMNENLSTGQVGQAIALGLIEGVNLSGYDAGDEVYVAAGGGWTDVRPTGTSIVQALGVVTKGGAGGKGFVYNAGEFNLPNIAEGFAWVGNSSSYPVAVATSSIVVDNAISASYALSASHADSSNTTVSASYALSASHADSSNTSVSASHAVNADNAISASFATTALSASYAPDTTFPYTGSALITGSLIVTGSISTTGVVNLTGTNKWINSSTTSTYPAGDGLTVVASANPSLNASARYSGIFAATNGTIGSNGFMSFILGGDLNDANGIRTGVVGGYNNNVSVGNSYIFGGSENDITGGTLTQVILGGNNINITAGADVVGIGGINNTISGGSYGAILAGSGNLNNQNRSVIIGGQNITASAADTVYVPSFNASGSVRITGSFIQGAGGNTVSDPNSGMLTVGSGNSITATQAAIIGGVGGNTNNAGGGVMVGADRSTMNGGYGLLAGTDASTQSGTGTITIGGDQHTNNSNKTAIVAGSDNDIQGSSDLSAIIGGLSNTVVTGHTGSVVLGGANLSTTKSDEVVVPRLTISGSFVDTMVIANYASIDFADDTAAAAGGIPLGGVYRNGNFLMIRIS